ncbi:MAG TPA: galactose-1-phosphate uridylyltransferase [Fimbriimonadaceae bacterium]|nr:galactose-1-phosphate uridylyltransferase [Fimbriimonadaceae bacterium]
MSELRYHPFLDQWVITATHRQDRTFLPPDDYCPLCPTKPGGFPTEVPMPTYDIVVFENKFPSLQSPAPDPAIAGSVLMPVRPSGGVCEVVSYSEQHDATFATMPYSQIRKLVRVWRERYMELSGREEVEYVFIFENKGKEIGVTLSHPHGQIYAYPFIPPTLRAELESEKRHLDRTGRLLMQDWLDEELRERVRLVSENETFVAVVPFFARYPYELYVASKRHIRSLAEMSDSELDDLAEILLVVAKKYDLLFGFSLPYMMLMHQEPAIRGYEFNWFHIEFYPPYRTAKKLKYLAGSEAGAGAFINDTLPEETSKTLRDLEIPSVR